jgi:hypothetical protein
MQMTYESMMSFAGSWIAAWNRRDIEAVLAHFAEEAQFVSPVARQLAGRSVLQNKKELEGYWRAALARISTLDFKLDHATWDERRRELNVIYEARRPPSRRRPPKSILPRLPRCAGVFPVWSSHEELPHLLQRGLAKAGEHSPLSSKRPRRESTGPESCNVRTFDAEERPLLPQHGNSGRGT